jgi:hypothetical protein
MSAIIDHGDNDALELDNTGFHAALDYIRTYLPKRSTITPQRAAAALRLHNIYRHGNGPMGSPGELTLALDYAANVLERMP